MHRRMRAIAVAAVLVLAATAGADRLAQSGGPQRATTEPGVVLVRTGAALAPAGTTRHARERLPLLVVVFAGMAAAAALARRHVVSTARPGRVGFTSTAAPSRAPPFLPVLAR